MKPVERIIFWGAVGIGGYVVYKSLNPDKYQPVNLPDTRPAIRTEGELVTPDTLDPVVPVTKENTKVGAFLRKLGIGTGKRKRLKVKKATTM
jgi:hypothetical protein